MAINVIGCQEVSYFSSLFSHTNLIISPYNPYLTQTFNPMWDFKFSFARPLFGHLFLYWPCVSYNSYHMAHLTYRLGHRTITVYMIINKADEPVQRPGIPGLPRWMIARAPPAIWVVILVVQFRHRHWHRHYREFQWHVQHHQINGHTILVPRDRPKHNQGLVD